MVGLSKVSPVPSTCIMHERVISVFNSGDAKCNWPCGDQSRVADSRVQCLNHSAIKVPERPSRSRLARSLHYSPFLKSEPPGSGHSQPRRGASTQANPITFSKPCLTDPGISDCKLGDLRYGRAVDLFETNNLQGSMYWIDSGRVITWAGRIHIKTC